MFVNPKFNKKNLPSLSLSKASAPKFHNAFVCDPERDRDDHKSGSSPYLKARISRDYDIPPKTLIAIDFYDIPDDATGSLKNVYDYIYGVSLTPEDTIKFIRWLNTLLSALFNEENQINM